MVAIVMVSPNSLSQAYTFAEAKTLERAFRVDRLVLLAPIGAGVRT
jgi:hypothetical protein